MKPTLGLICLLLAGCTTPRPAGVTAGNVDRLLAHPQFRAAAVAAPAFTADALNTVAQLEHDLALATAEKGAP